MKFEEGEFYSYEYNGYNYILQYINTKQGYRYFKMIMQNKMCIPSPIEIGGIIYFINTKKFFKNHFKKI